MTTSAPLTLHELAARAGHAAWAEARLFELVGGWITSTPEVELVGHLAAQSRRHAWHAELWAGRIPEATIVDVSALTRPASSTVERVLDRVTVLEDTVDRLGALGRLLLPGLLAAYDDHLGRTSPVCDGATIRTLDLVRADLRADLETLAGLLAGLSSTDRVGDGESELAEALEAAGGLLGSLPDQA